ncbi:hypothetical protein R5W24_003904 [Gemmata sp. JC717]|uniref:hypothetical protein n=1 Tax=Gemmata algarum TaxID=2975278 RepID=UPI0021BA7BDF|nr:hypothetical protein [Gemmata algarum]MDY3554775.1 hypothetical protein [Gemmata algarum]
MFDDWPFKDQFNRPACAAFGVVAAVEWRHHTPANAQNPHAVFPRYGEQHLYWDARVREGVFPIPPDEGAHLKLVAEASTLVGIAHDHLWPYAADPAPAHHCPATHAGLPHLTGATPPATGVRADAAARLCPMTWVDLSGPRRAERVLDALRLYGPLALSLPVAGRDKRDPEAEASEYVWTNPQTRTDGIIADPPAGWEPVGAGHTVCVVAALPDPRDRARAGRPARPARPVFVFRNSWPNWGTHPNGLPRGYGRVRWSFVDKYARSMAHWSDPAVGHARAKGVD